MERGRCVAGLDEGGAGGLMWCPHAFTTFDADAGFGLRYNMYKTYEYMNIL